MRLCTKPGTLLLLVVACFTVFNVAPPFFVRASRVELKENGYTGIVVALSARLQGNVAGRQLIPPLEDNVDFLLDTKDVDTGFVWEQQDIWRCGAEVQ
ncbi:hypothetical protein HPB51_011814 [Rhipicephalus microplus]|uniref:Uncharacterized protein n=1 Tax=Rhipicephalus microplus TaxID=6941 RepID=A0A9J6DGB4_RHIMP|nr:hypothetical protein HPB51_011814 [Rhipicephalus microplus]